MSPIALANILLEASMGPISNSGRMTGHGNLVDARAKCRTTGNAIAASQQTVLLFRSLDFSEFVMVDGVAVFLGGGGIMLPEIE